MLSLILATCAVGFINAESITLDNGADNTAILEQYDGQTVDVTILNVFFEGPIALTRPFDLDDFTGTPLEGANIFKLVGSYIMNKQSGTDSIYICMQEVTNIEAGTPYIAINIPADVPSATFNGVVVKAALHPTVTDEVDFIPTYAKGEMLVPEGLENESSVVYLGLDAFYSEVPGRQHLEIGAFRAYYQMKRHWIFFNSDFKFLDKPTAVTTIRTDQAAPVSKGYYTIDGRKLQQMPTQPGIYIIDGKKVLVK